MPNKRKYYSSRHSKRKFDKFDLYNFFKNLYSFFKEKDYFKEKLGIMAHDFPKKTIYEAAIKMHFDIFPIEEWSREQINQDNVFDAIEYLYDHVSKPGEIEDYSTSGGYNYSDYESYDSEAGKSEFREYVNSFLCDYEDRFELSSDGEVELIGEGGLEYVFQAEIIQYDHDNVDIKVMEAIKKWKNRHYDINDRKQAILDLTGVFEWLKKCGKLEKALNKKDESAIFDIANNFALRHHNPAQKSGYDVNIWYSWIFHFYLATYHAAIRIIKRQEEDEEF